MERHLERALEAVDAVAGSLTPEAIASRSGDKWSIAEILEHLTLAFTLNRAALEKAIESGEPRARPPRLAQRLGRVLVIDLGYFPRVEAPEASRPTGSIPPDRSLTAVREAITALDATLSRAADRFGDRLPVVNHPYFAGLSVRQWRRFHLRHTRHHMKQVRDRSRSA